MRILFLWAAMLVYAGAPQAATYGFVEDGRVSVMYSDTQPEDGRYVLFQKDLPAAPASALAAGPYSGHILAAARQHSVDPVLIHAVITVESGYNPSARSRAGAVGLMQLMPGTAKRYGVKNRLDPEQNINGGVRYLRDLQIQFDDNLQLVLAAYNAGERAVLKYGRRIPPYRETVAYVPKVLKLYRKHRPTT